MSLVENEWGLVCTWCGDEVDRVTDPDDDPERPVGVCAADGVVFVASPERVEP